MRRRIRQSGSCISSAPSIVAGRPPSRNSSACIAAKPRDHRREGDLADHVRAVRQRQLDGERVPRRVAIEAVQVGAAQATGQPGQDERADAAGVARRAGRAGARTPRACKASRRSPSIGSSTASTTRSGRSPNGSGRQSTSGACRRMARARGLAERHALVGRQQTARNGVVQARRRHVGDMDPADAGSGEDGGDVRAGPAAARARRRCACRRALSSSDAASPARADSAVSSAPSRGRGGASRRSVSRRARSARGRGQSRPASTSSRCSTATARRDGAVGARPSRCRTASVPTPSRTTRRAPTSSWASCAERQSSRPAGWQRGGGRASVGAGHRPTCHARYRAGTAFPQRRGYARCVVHTCG